MPKTPDDKKVVGGSLKAEFADGSEHAFELTEAEMKVALIAVEREKRRSLALEEAEYLKEINRTTRVDHATLTKRESIQIYKEHKRGFSTEELADAHQCSEAVILGALKRCAQGRYGDLDG